MAISPPSDLVLDVVRAADPTEVQAAQAKLKANQAAFAANSLAEAGKGFSSAVDILNRTDAKSAAERLASQTAEGDKVPPAYRKFEAMVLQSFVKDMLPKESESVFGKGATGDIWKGMMAEQMGNVMAEGRGIGIAEQLYKSELNRKQGIVNAMADQNDRRMAMSMVDEIERKVLGVQSDETKSATQA